MLRYFNKTWHSSGGIPIFAVEERFTRESNRLPEKDLDKIAKAYHELLHSIGENEDRQVCAVLQNRAARPWNFSRKGYRQDLDEIITTPVFDSSGARSFCERH